MLKRRGARSCGRGTRARSRVRGTRARSHGRGMTADVWSRPWRASATRRSSEKTFRGAAALRGRSTATRRGVPSVEERRFQKTVARIRGTREPLGIRTPHAIYARHCYEARSTATRCGSPRRDADHRDEMRITATRCGSPLRGADHRYEVRITATRCGSLLRGVEHRCEARSTATRQRLRSNRVFDWPARPFRSGRLVIHAQCGTQRGRCSGVRAPAESLYSRFFQG